MITDKNTDNWKTSIDQLEWCPVVCYSVYVPVTAAVCVGLKWEHQMVAAGIDHTNDDRYLSLGMKS